MGENVGDFSPRIILLPTQVITDDPKLNQIYQDIHFVYHKFTTSKQVTRYPRNVIKEPCPIKSVGKQSALCPLKMEIDWGLMALPA